MSDIEKRLYNTERALHGLWSMLEDLQPPAYAERINELMEEYFDTNVELGSGLDTSTGFISSNE